MSLRRIVSIWPITVAAGTAKTYHVMQPALAGRIVTARIVNDATVAADGVNYVTVGVRKGTTVMYDISTTPTGFTADTWREMAASSTLSNLDFAKDDQINVNVAHTGTGAALTDAAIYLEVEVESEPIAAGRN